MSPAFTVEEFPRARRAPHGGLRSWPTGFRQSSTPTTWCRCCSDHMAGLARRAGGAVRAHRTRPVGDRAALRPGGLRRPQGLPLGRRLDRLVPARGQRGPVRASARRLAIPELPDELFIESLRQLIAVDHEWVPAAGESSRFTCGRSSSPPNGAGVRPSEYRYLVIASPGQGPTSGRHQAVGVWLSHASTCAPVRAAPARRSSAAPRRLAAGPAEASAQGDQVVWLDAIERRYVRRWAG